MTDADYEKRIALAIQYNREHGNRLRGKLFTVIETMGLRESQENAVKRLIRSTTYDGQADVEASLRGNHE